MTILESAQKAAAQKDLRTIDDLWTEMVMSNNYALEDFFSITHELKKQGAPDHALFLLEILADHLKSQNQLRPLVELYKNILQYKKEDSGIRTELADLFRKLYKNSRHIEEYIEIAGIDKVEPIYRALKKLEEFLHYDIGQFFYFERYGLGEVVDAIPSKREVVIDFEKKKRHFLTLDVAKGILTPINSDHFLYKKYKNIEELKNLARAEPARLIEFILRSFHEPLTASQIKGYLDGVVEKEAISQVWEKARKSLAQAGNIRVTGKTVKTYQYVDGVIDKGAEAMSEYEDASPKDKYRLAENYARKMPAVFKQLIPKLVALGNEIRQEEPALALDIFYLFDELGLEPTFTYDHEQILSTEKPEHIIFGLQNINHQKKVIEVIRQKNADQWADILKAAFFNADDHKLLEEIARNLENAPDQLAEIYRSILTTPRQYPQQFQWLLKKMQNNELDAYLKPTIIPRLIDAVDSMKGIKSIVEKILSLENFERLLSQAAEEDAKRIRDSINLSQTMSGHVRKQLLRIVEYHFPQLFERKTVVVYTTQEAFKKKEEELKRLITIEIPANKKEISRAREFGDLSENFEYKAAKERQDQLYQKVRTLDTALKNVKIIDPQMVDTNRVNIGTKVILKNLDNNQFLSYTILGRWDTDLENNIIANEAPLAQSLMGKTIGDKLSINNTIYEVVTITKGL